MIELNKLYSNIKKQIILRLKEFENKYKTGSPEEIFCELIFCLLTPQSKAKKCWIAVGSLRDNGLLHSNNINTISKKLNGVRFHNNKSKYIIEARKKFGINGNFSMKIATDDNKTPFETREWLVKNIKGMGYKEASHFLRNIGLGKDLAILDRHILKNLQLYRVISRVPKHLSRKKYMEIESKVKDFSIKVGIPLSHLDLLLWYKGAGEIFK